MKLNNAIFINIRQYSVNIGNPKPCLLRFRLAAGVLFLLAILKKTCLNFVLTFVVNIL